MPSRLERPRQRKRIAPVTVEAAPDVDTLKKNLKLLQGKSDGVLDEYRISSVLSRLSENDLKAIRRGQSEADLFLAQRVIEFNQELVAYIQICLHRRKERMAERAIEQHSIKPEAGRYRWKYLNSPEPFNELLKLYATKTNRFKLIVFLFRLMREMEIKPNVSSFAAALVSQGRQDCPNANLVKSMVTDLQQRYDLEDLAKVEWLDYKWMRALSEALASGGYRVSAVNKYFEGVDPPTVRVETDRVSNVHEQIDNEEAGFVVIPCCGRNNPTGNVNNFKADELEKQFRSQLTSAIYAKKELLKKKTAKDPYILPILETFSVATCADIMIQVMKDVLLQSKLFSPSPRYVAFLLGDYLQNLFMIAHKQRTGYKDQLLVVYKHFLAEQCSRFDAAELWDQSQIATKTIVPTIKLSWPAHFRIKVGQCLLDIMVDSLKFKAKSNGSDNSVQALQYVNECVNGEVECNVKVHADLIDLFEPDLNGQALKLHSTMMPCLTAPVPWLSEQKGGLLLSQVDLIRTHVQKDVGPVSRPVLEALNVLGNVPWRVNSTVLDVIMKLFKAGGDEQLEIPCCPADALEDNLPAIKKGCSPSERKRILKARAMMRKNRAEMYSIWCNENYRLSIANYLRGRTFWLPHNVDFRGRAYPIAPYFNHLGNDVSRSLMLFAKGKPLGPDGLRWLKIHFVNLTEHKKSCSLKEREAYADEKMDEIFDSALRPLEGRGFWRSAEKPWQALACAMELYNAMQSPNPEEYLSQFPVHQDGSCNVLQHYAALGRDKIGAEMVNLLPSERPNDVYTAVAELVEKERSADEAAGVKIAEHLRGVVSRKVIKQTVMTTVYGVTEYGARRQIAKQLAEKGYDASSMFEASTYLAKKTFRSIRQMFTSAREIQDWLTDSAQMMCRLTGQPIEWTTPLGFLVSQPYFKSKKDASVKKAVWVPDSRKQSTAIPPNFIHSLDSTHMMMTSLSCRRNGLDFVSVHDSFWTHACDVDLLGKICREEFVKLHQQPILENLSAEWIAKLGDQTCLSNQASLAERQKHALWMLSEMLRSPPPPKGSLDINEVLQSPYFFS